MLALPGTEPALAAVGPSVPLLTSDRVIIYGDSLPTADHERDLVEKLGISHVTAAEVHVDPVVTAARARALAEAAASAYLVHFDVDVLSFMEAPLADVPEPVGLTLAEASTTLSTFSASPSFAGLTVTEIHPDHLPDEETLPAFTRMLAVALAG
jgi:arginase